jgi:hypothetical protein
MVAAELFGGVVVGSVGRSDSNDTLPMPAVSQVKTGVLLTVACALDRFESALLATTSLGAEDPPPPQATSAAALSDDTHSIPARRRDEFIDMTSPLSFLVQAWGTATRTRCVERVSDRCRRAAIACAPMACIGFSENGSVHST